MIRAIIVDDQKSFLKAFKKMVQVHFSDKMSLIAECETVKEALHAIHNYHPDLIFLDIELRNESGFELLEQIPEKCCEVIFTAAHEQSAIKAIRFNAIDFLLKPFDESDLQRAIDRFENSRSPKMMLKKLELLQQNIKTLSDPHKKIALPTAHGFDVVELNTIIHLYTSGNYTIFCLTNNQDIVVTHPLGDYEILLDEFNFFRTHQSHIVNMNHVKSYSRIDGGKILLSNGNEVEVSRRKREDFIKRLYQVIR